MPGTPPNFAAMWAACSDRHPALLDAVHSLYRISRHEDLYGLKTQPWRRLQYQHLHDYLLLKRHMGFGAPVRSGPTDILLSCFPTRSDYLALLAPVARRLHARGLRCVVLVAGSSRPQGSQRPFFPAEVIPLALLVTASTMRRAKHLYGILVPHVNALAGDLAFNTAQRAGAAAVFRQYAWDAALMDQALRRFQPRLLLGIHFLDHPGFLRSLRHRGDDLKTVLIQHGAFSGSWEAHDYAGADAVVLWGSFFRDELAGFAVQPHPEPVVLGNPKLEQDIARHSEQLPEETGRREKTVLYVSTNGEPRPNALALETFALAVQDAADWRIIYKPHPAENLGEFRRLQRSGLIRKSQVLPPHADTRRCIVEAEVVVGTQSTVLPEAVALGRPVVQLLPEHFDMGWEGLGMRTASSTQALREALDKLMADPAERLRALEEAKGLVQTMFSELHGSADRIAGYVASELGRQAATRPDVVQTTAWSVSE